MKNRKTKKILKLQENFDQPIFYKSKIKIFDSIYKYLNWYEIFFIIAFFFAIVSIFISQIKYLIINEYYYISLSFYPLTGLAILLLLSFNLILIIATHQISRQNKKCETIFLLWLIGIMIFFFSLIAINLTKKEIEDQKNILQI